MGNFETKKFIDYIYIFLYIFLFLFSISFHILLAALVGSQLQPNPTCLGLKGYVVVLASGESSQHGEKIPIVRVDVTDINYKLMLIPDWF